VAAENNELTMDKSQRSIFVDLYRLRDMSELSFVRSLMDGAEVEFHIANEHYFSLDGGMSIGANQAVLCVRGKDALKVARLLVDGGICNQAWLRDVKKALAGSAT
jgi:hypothetical protein